MRASRYAATAPKRSVPTANSQIETTLISFESSLLTIIAYLPERRLWLGQAGSGSLIPVSTMDARLPEQLSNPPCADPIVKLRSMDSV